MLQAPEQEDGKLIFDIVGCEGLSPIVNALEFSCRKARNG